MIKKHSLSLTHASFSIEQVKAKNVLRHHRR